MKKTIKDFYRGMINWNRKYAEIVYDDFKMFLTNPSYTGDKNINDYIPSMYLEDIDIKSGYNNKKYYNLYISLFMIFKLTKHIYNLNEVEELILEENFSTAIKNYSTLVITDDSDYCVYRDSINMYTLEINKEFIDKIRLLVGNYKLNKKSFISLGMDIYNFYNHPIFNENIKDMVNSNIDINDILSLTRYTKNMNLITRYIHLLNTDDKQYKKLLLEFIKPISTDITFNDVDNYGMFYPCCSDDPFIGDINNFIRNEKAKNKIEKYNKYHLNINLYFLKLFENYFINKIDELEKISCFSNRLVVMASLIKYKRHLLRNINKFEIVEGKVDYNVERCNKLKKEFDDLFENIMNDIKDNKEVHKIKLKVDNNNN